MEIIVDKYFVINKQHEVLTFFKEDYNQMYFPRYINQGEYYGSQICEVLQEAGIIQEGNREFLFEQCREYLQYNHANGKLKKERKVQKKRYYFVVSELTEEVTYKLAEVCNQLGLTFSFVPISLLVPLVEESYRVDQKQNEEEGILKATKELQYKMKMKEE